MVNCHKYQIGLDASAVQRMGQSWYLVQRRPSTIFRSPIGQAFFYFFSSIYSPPCLWSVIEMILELNTMSDVRDTKHNAHVHHLHTFLKQITLRGGLKSLSTDPANVTQWCRVGTKAKWLN